MTSWSGEWSVIAGDGKEPGLALLILEDERRATTNGHHKEMVPGDSLIHRRSGYTYRAKETLMRIIGVRSGVSSFVSAVALLLLISPALAGGQADAQLPTNTQRPVEVAFTKWRTAQIPPLPAVAVRSLFAGIVGGDLGEGDFVGEVIDRKVSTPCTAFQPTPCTPGIEPATITGSIIALHAIYEVQVGEHSFTALIQGGTNGVTTAALLNGVILAGWRTGAPVHVAFQTISSCTDRDGGTHGPCFQGTIRIERPLEE